MKGTHDGGGAEVVVVERVESSTAGSFFRGRFRSSSVIPSNFVMPTTGGSLFLTNSHCPKSTSQYSGLESDLQDSRTWQLVPSKPERIPDDLLVDEATNLKDNLVDGDSGRPMVERALALTHSHLSPQINHRQRN